MAAQQSSGRISVGHTSWIVVDDVAAQADFLRQVFGATGDVDPDRPAEVRIGDSLLMISSAGERAAFPAFLYVYVDDADADVRARDRRRRQRSSRIPLDTPVRRPPGDGQ